MAGAGVGGPTQGDPDVGEGRGQGAVVAVLDALDGQRDPGRAIRHRITAKGEAIRREGQRRVTAVVERSFAGLSPDQLDQLGALLERVLQQPLDREPTGIGS